MKKIITLFVTAIAFQFTYSQNVGIGTNAPNASAQLDVTSTTRGMLVPRMTTTQRTAIASPATGLLVYDTDTNSFWFYGGSAWTNLLTTGTGWSLNGNIGTNPSINFIGTADNNSLSFKVNNQRAGYLGNGTNDGNVFWGYQAGNFNTAYSNIGLGIKALYSNTNISNLVAVGDSALYNNSSGVANTALGSKALYKNTIGFKNTATGYYALFSNLSGNENTAIGHLSLYNNTSDENTAVGASSLSANSSGNWNTAVGANACISNSAGSYNSALGAKALYNALSSQNTALGTYSLTHVINGDNNTGLGFGSDVGNYNVYNSTAVGALAQVDCSNCMVLGSVKDVNTATSDVKIGIGLTNPQVKLHVKDGPSGYAGGYFPGLVFEGNGNRYFNLITPSANEGGVLFGLPSNAAHGGIIYNDPSSLKGFQFRTNGNATQMVLDSSGHLGIGYNLFNPSFPLTFGPNLGDKISLYGNSGNHYGFGIQGNLMQIYSDGINSDIAFGSGSSGSFTENVRFLGDGFVGIGTAAPTQRLSVVGNICATGTIGSCSDIRYKTNILPVTDALSSILNIHGIFYNWNTSSFPELKFSDKKQIGFSAQEVEKIFPEIVATDAKGYKSIDYGKMSPILVEAIKEQQTTIAKQQQQIDGLLKEIELIKAKLK